MTTSPAAPKVLLLPFDPILHQDGCWSPSRRYSRRHGLSFDDVQRHHSQVSREARINREGESLARALQEAGWRHRSLLKASRWKGLLLLVWNLFFLQMRIKNSVLPSPTIPQRVWASSPGSLLSSKRCWPICMLKYAWSMGSFLTFPLTSGLLSGGFPRVWRHNTMNCLSGRSRVQHW